MRYQKLILAMILLYVCPLYSANWVDENDEYSIDWTTLRLSFSGYSENQGSFEKAVQKAWGSGLIGIRDAAKSLYLERVFEGHPGRLRLAEEAGKLIARNTFETKTLFSNSGDVRVEMQSLLSNAFPLEPASFLDTQSNYNSAAYSGVLFTFSQADNIKPLPVMQIFDSEGQLFYSPKSISKQVYSKRLMGRWLQKASAKEIARYLGPKILTLKIEPVEGQPATFRLTSSVDSSLRKIAKQILSEAEVVFHVR